MPVVRTRAPIILRPTAATASQPSPQGPAPAIVSVEEWPAEGLRPIVSAVRHDPSTGWVPIQAATRQPSGSMASASATFTVPVSAGDLLVVAVAAFLNAGGTPTLGVSDSGSNGYTPGPTALSPDGKTSISLFYAVAAGSSSLTVTATSSPNSFLAIGASEFAPPAGSPSIAVVGSNSATGASSTPSCGALTFSGVALVFGAVAVQGSLSTGPIGASAGFALSYQLPQASNVIPLAADYALNDSSSPATPGFTIGAGSRDWAGAGMAFAVTSVSRGPSPSLVAAEGAPPYPGSALVLRTAAPPSVAPSARVRPVRASVEELPAYPGSALVLRPTTSIVYPQANVRPFVASVEEPPAYPGSAIRAAPRTVVVYPPGRSSRVVAAPQEPPPEGGRVLVLRPDAIVHPPPRRAAAVVRPEDVTHPGEAIVLRRHAPPPSGRVLVVSVAATFELTPAVPIQLGRFRLGDVVTLAFTAPATPVAAPSAAIVSPTGSTVATVPLWTPDGGATFLADVLLDQGYGPGTYSVGGVFAYTAGITVRFAAQFTAVAGGDPAGGVISIYEHEGADGRVVIVQVQAGRLLQGSDPWAS